MIESNKIKSVVTLKSVVANVKNDLKDYSQEGENRLMQFAIRGVRQLMLFGMPGYSSKWLPMTDINTINYPADMLTLIYVGIPYRGKLWTFTREGRLIDPVSEQNGMPYLDPDRGEDATIGDGGYIEGYGVSGGRNPFYFKHDEENRRGIINGFDRTEVLVYYISTGVSLDEETQIPGIAEEALIKWTHWKDIEYIKGIPAIEKKMAEDAFNNSFEILKNAQMPSLDDIYDQIYSAIYQTAKR